MLKKKRILTGLVLFLAALAMFAGGYFFRYLQTPAEVKITEVVNKEAGKPNKVDFSPFWSAWSLIKSNYAAKDEIDDQKLVWGAIEGMVASLKDPYTIFFPPQESKEFQDSIRGDFSGVGMEIGIKNGILTVISPLKDTPAYRAGIKSGDKILKIDDKETTGMTAEEAARLIRGEKGTAVKMIIMHKNEEEPVELKIIRDTIQAPILDTEEKPGGIFVIKLYSFAGNSVKNFRDALQQFVNSGNDKLVIDLRGNPGGFLESAVEASSWFLPSGKIVVREKFGNGEENVFRSKGYDIFKNLPLAIIVDEGSASASEIMAGALQEHGVAKLVGTKTFGKGSVQELFDVTSKTSVKITIAKWLTPGGRSISDQGLEPDFKVEITKKDIEAEKDPQMDKALEVVKNWKK